MRREEIAAVGQLAGDAAAGTASRSRFPIEHYHHVGGANHFEMLNHPAIYSQIRRWMAPRRALPATAQEAALQRP